MPAVSRVETAGRGGGTNGGKVSSMEWRREEEVDDEEDDDEERRCWRLLSMVRAWSWRRRRSGEDTGGYLQESWQGNCNIVSRCGASECSDIGGGDDLCFF